MLIFEAAWHLKPRLLKAWILPVLLLATLGVLISCFVTAGLVYLGIGHAAGFPWLAALLTGAILAATDPHCSDRAVTRAGGPGGPAYAI